MFSSMMGATYLDAFLANMVRAGILDREEALRRLQTEGQLSLRRKEDACEMMDLKKDFFQPAQSGGRLPKTALANIIYPNEG